MASNPIRCPLCNCSKLTWIRIEECYKTTFKLFKFVKNVTPAHLRATCVGCGHKWPLKSGTYVMKWEGDKEDVDPRKLPPSDDYL